MKKKQPIPEWIENGEICRGCGACCADVSTAPITMKDIRRLMTGLKLTFDQVLKLGWQDPKTDAFLFDMSQGCCQALRIHTTKDGHTEYPCGIYEHRPDICRRYECPVLFDLHEYVDAGKQPLRGSNLFANVAPEHLKKAAFAARQYMRSLLFWDSARPDLRPSERPHMRDTTKKILARQLVQLEPIFPPKR